MACYVVQREGIPSAEEYAIWQRMGYIGSFELYCEQVRRGAAGNIFICGDLGPHCRDCAAPSELLCDFPVGQNGVTCDAPLCPTHAREVGEDIHYCAGHYKSWKRLSDGSLAALLREQIRPIHIGAAEND